MSASRIDLLTEAQRACLRLVLTHHNSKEIAALLGVSPSAIDKRIERAVQVLGAGSRFEAARLLQRHETAGDLDTPAEPRVMPSATPEPRAASDAAWSTAASALRKSAVTLSVA